MTRPLRLAALAGCAALLAGGCALDVATHTMGRYGIVRAVPVTLRCRDTYEVYDRPDLSSLLVVTNVLSEALAGCLDGGPPTAERQRQVARLYFEEKTDRPLCVIGADTALTAVHREFAYRCPADPKAQPPRLPGRG